MTLGQTREKIQALEVRHRELQEKKQELFLTLKKLLNEDENRKKQQQKESNEMYAMHNLMPQPGSFMPPRPMQQGGMIMTQSQSKQSAFQCLLSFQIECPKDRTIRIITTIPTITVGTITITRVVVVPQEVDKDRDNPLP